MNWPQIIRQLLETGLSESAIAGDVGVKQPTINRLKLGKVSDPSYTLGSALVRLHQERCGTDQEHAA